MLLKAGNELGTSFHGLEKGGEPEGQEGTLAPEEGYVEDASASMPGEPTLYDALPKESVVEKLPSIISIREVIF